MGVIDFKRLNSDITAAREKRNKGENKKMAANTSNVVDIDLVFNTEIDMDEAAAIAESQLLPEGNYITIAPLNVGEPRQRTVKTLGERVNGTVQQLNEPVEIERTTIQFYGQAIDADGVNQGKVSFNISPQAVFKLSQKGKFGPDVTTKITQSLMKIYKTERDQSPSNYGELIEFVKTTPVQVFVGKLPASDDGQWEASNMVFSVSRVK